MPEIERVYLSGVKVRDLFISLAGTRQVYIVLDVNKKLGSLKIQALTAPAKGASGSARAPAKGEIRVVSNGHQWCSRVARYTGPIGE